MYNTAIGQSTIYPQCVYREYNIPYPTIYPTGLMYPPTPTAPHTYG